MIAVRGVDLSRECELHPPSEVERGLHVVLPEPVSRLLEHEADLPADLLALEVVPRNRPAVPQKVEEGTEHDRFVPPESPDG